MPTALVARINLDLLYPPFVPPLLETLAACQARGAHYYANLGFRTFAEQAKLYFQGRTLPGDKVTNAPAGLSCHNYGIAVDLIRDADLAKAGLQPDWDSKGYDILKEEGTKRGLQVGVPSIPGGDPGHVQLPLIKKLDRREKAILLDLKILFEKSGADGGMPAVWKQLDAWGPWVAASV